MMAERHPKQLQKVRLLRTKTFENLAAPDRPAGKELIPFESPLYPKEHVIDEVIDFTRRPQIHRKVVNSPTYKSGGDLERYPDLRDGRSEMPEQIPVEYQHAPSLPLIRQKDPTVKSEVESRERRRPWCKSRPIKARCKSVGTDTDALHIHSKIEDERRKHQFQIMQFRMEIAEAQTLLFFLSEQCHLQCCHKGRMNDSPEERETDASHEESHAILQSTKANKSHLPHKLHSGNNVQETEDSTEHSFRPDAPRNLRAERMTLDDRWFVRWDLPELNELGENNGIKIDGYRISIQNVEIKRVNSPWMNKALVCLQFWMRNQETVELCVQTIGAVERYSEVALINLGPTMNSTVDTQQQQNPS